MRFRKTLLLLWLFPAILAAQDDWPCNGGDTVESCLKTLAAGEVAAAGKGAAAEVRKKTDKALGTDTFGSKFASTYKDFLPLFDGILTLDSIAEDGQSLTFNINPGGPSKRFQLQAKLWKPEVHEALLKAFPEEIRAARRESLEDGFTDFEDREIIATYRVNRSRGRNALLYDQVFSRLVREVDISPASLNRDKLEKYLQPFESELTDLEDSATLRQLIAVPGFHLETFQGLARKVAQSGESYRQAVLDQLEKHFDPLANLVNNATQVYLSAAYRSRDDLVGPDTFSLKFTYEMGFADMGSLEKRWDEACREDDGDPGASAAAKCEEDQFIKVLESWQTVEAGDRLAFSLEYSDSSGDLLEFPEDAVSLMSADGTSLVANVAYGRYLGAKTSSPRLDVAVSYEDVDDDPNRRDRWLGSVTFSQKVSETLSIPIGIVYSNHSKFLTDVDEQFSAHFGLRYKLPWDGE